ncbi:MAG: class I SAM-dependent methyltransferase [Bacteroidota bacterium]|jgi:ubiquinone/menaquinone biosynthesis C-methylase UbiE
MKNEARHAQLNQAKWDNLANSVDSKGWRYDYLRAAQSKVVSLLDVKEDIHFLDVGCGTGWAIGEVAKLVNDKGLFYGVDLSSKMIEKAKGDFSGKDNFHFIKANAESIPLNDNFFDIIICTNSFHHYLNPSKALIEIFRLLKRGGKVYILDPTADNWIVKVVDKVGKLFEPEHVKLYSTKEFQRLFYDAGLRYTASETIKGHQKVHIGEK